jgi:F420-non-reducing hydrogenase small subunit
MTKPKLGLYWCAGCGGCEESVVDLAEHLLDVVGAVDIVFWPVAMDFKYSDVEALADGELAAVFINGAIRLDEQARVATLLRRKSRLVIAHGACAHLGGVVGLGNLSTREALLDRAYAQAETLVPGEVPPSARPGDGQAPALPSLLSRTRSLDQVIAVDYYLPGCPPAPENLLAAIQALLGGTLPPKGTVLGEPRSLCSSCERRDSKPERLEIQAWKRVHEVVLSPGTCFLAQGVLCLGPATRGGCASRCIGGNMPCTGSYGPPDRVMEQGLKAASMVASMSEANAPAAAEAFVASLADPAGTFYRYSLATSVLRGQNKKDLP